MAIFSPQEVLKTGTPDDPIIYIGTAVGASGTTLTFTSGILDKDGNAPSGKIGIVAKIFDGDNAGYEEMIEIPASGLNAAGTVATGVTRGVIVSGRTATGSSANTVALPGSNGTVIDVVLSPQHMQGMLDVIDGDIGTGSNNLRIGDETDSDITLYFQNADANKPYIQYDKTLNGIEMSVDGSVVETLLTATALSPGVSDGTALGTTALMWSDLFLASGGVINFNNGDVTATHSANTLAFAGASSGYTFDAALLPSPTDGAALGSATVMWSDLFLASGSVVNFNNGDVTMTHASNSLTISGGYVGIGVTPTANMTGLAIEDGVLTLKETTTPTADANYGKIYTKNDNSLYFQNGAGDETEIIAGATHLGEMYMYESAATQTIDTTNAYHLMRNFSTGDLATFTFNAGSTGSITVYADYSGTVAGTVLATSVGHNLATGDEVSITGSTNYNGIFTITVVSADTFYFTDTWVADDATGTWSEGSYLEAGAGADGKYLLNFSITAASAVASKNFKFEVYKNSTPIDTAAAEMTPGSTNLQNCGASGFIDIVEGDRIYLAIKNRTDSANLDLEHANVNLHII